MRRVGVFLAILAAALAATAAVAAAQDGTTLDGKLRTGDRVSLPAGETLDDDLYAFAGTVAIDGDVTGDVIVFGGQVEVTGRVGGDVIAAGGTVEVSGPVEGDARVTGGTVIIASEVAEDLLIGAGQVTVEGDIGGDLIFGTGQMALAGSVAGDVVGRTGEYDKTGTVVGTENVRIETPTEETRSVLARAVTTYVAVLLVGLLVGMIRRGHRLGVTIGMLRREPGGAALWGLVFLATLLVTPVATLMMGVLLVVVFGWFGLGHFVALVILTILAIWAVMALAAFVLFALLAPVSVGTWLGGLVLPDTTPTFVAMAVGVAIVVAARFIPYVGPVVGLIVAIFGAGAWLRSLRHDAETAPVAAPT